MKKFSRKLMSIIISAAMIVAMTSAVAFADDDIVTDDTSVQEPETVVSEESGEEDVVSEDTGDAQNVDEEEELKAVESEEDELNGVSYYVCVGTGGFSEVGQVITCGSGTATLTSYSEDTGAAVVTLNNASIDAYSGEHDYGLYARDDLTVVLQGSNNIKSYYQSIYSESGDVTVKGSGSAYIESYYEGIESNIGSYIQQGGTIEFNIDDDEGIAAEGDITISNGAKLTGYAYCEIVYSANGDVTISDSSIEVDETDENLICGGDVTITNSEISGTSVDDSSAIYGCGDVTITNTKLDITGYDGIYINEDDPADVVLNGCSGTINASDDEGSGIENSNGKVTLTDCDLDITGEMFGITAATVVFNGTNVEVSGDFYGVATANDEVDGAGIQVNGGYVKAVGGFAGLLAVNKPITIASNLEVVTPANGKTLSGVVEFPERVLRSASATMNVSTVTDPGVSEVEYEIIEGGLCELTNAAKTVIIQEKASNNSSDSSSNKTKSPKTGDSANMSFWMILMLAGAACAGTVAYRRRREF